MKETTPNDSILLPEGVVEDDVKILWMNNAFTDIARGELWKDEERKKEKED